MANNAAQHFKDLFFSTSKIPTGSVTEYYTDVSGGKIALGGEVVGPFRMPQKLSDYAHGKSGFGNVAPNLQTLAADALAAADSHINLGPYDNDGNGMVDAFIVVHAGGGAEVSGNRNDIWSAKWNLPREVSVDGVKVFGFLTIPEDAKIGVCAHELGHLVFGWPDLYDIDSPENGIIGVESAGIGNWCLMAGGSWGRLPGNPAGTTPCHPSAWCKEKQGWVTTVTETANRAISLGDVKTTREVHRLWTNGDTTSKEYFLIENRQLAGFDRSLPGPGLHGKSRTPAAPAHPSAHMLTFAQSLAH
jgi:immune inhibitor A